MIAVARSIPLHLLAASVRSRSPAERLYGFSSPDLLPVGLGINISAAL